MAVDYSLASKLAANSYLTARIEAAVVETCGEVMAESSGTSNHTERVALASGILGGNRAATGWERFVLPVAVNSTVLTAVDTGGEDPESEAASDDATDSDIEFVISSWWDHIAGVST